MYTLVPFQQPRLDSSCATTATSIPTPETVHARGNDSIIEEVESVGKIHGNLVTIDRESQHLWLFGSGENAETVGNGWTDTKAITTLIDRLGLQSRSNLFLICWY